MNLATTLLALLAAGFASAADPVAPVVAQHGNLLFVTAPAPSRSLPAGLLRQRLTVDFQDSGFSEVGELLRRTTGLNVVVAPGVLASGRTLTFAAKDMELGNVLNWVRTVGQVHVGWHNGALFISDEAVAAPSVTRVYDVSDLTMTITDFPGPELAIPEAGNGAQLIGAPLDERTSPSAEELAALINDIIAK